MPEPLAASSLPYPLFKKGKVRDIYIHNSNLLIFSSDRISAFDTILPALIPGKGEALHKLAVFWFTKTKHIIPNHFLSEWDSRTMLAQRAERIDIEWVVRSYLYGSAWRTYSQGARTISGVALPRGMTLAERFPEPILTPTTKADTGHDLEISKKHTLDRKLLTSQEWDALEEASFHLYEFYRAEADKRGIIIPDFKLEYGRRGSSLIQIDEPPTHDSARLWSKARYKAGLEQETHCLDKEFLREALRQLGYNGSTQPPRIPRSILEQVALRCTSACEVFTENRPLDTFTLKSVQETLATVQSL